MDSEADITLPALKFLTGENDHICRLCFSPTGEQEVNLDDSMSVQKFFIDETVTCAEMFNELNVSKE